MDQRGVGGLSQGGVAEQGMHGDEPSVSGPDGVVAFTLEVIEERTDERRVEVGEVELAGRLAGLPLGEAEQEPESVAVGGDRMDAGPALGHQPLGEE